MTSILHLLLYKAFFIRTCAPQGYVEAAQKFQQESMTQPGIDLAAITDRMEIRKAVQSGNVEEAIERVNDLNPEVQIPSVQ